jgi:hypothetical protein
MRSIRKDRFIDALQQASDHFLDEFVIPRRNAEWAPLAIGLGDVDSAYGLNAIATLFEQRNEVGHTFHGEAIHGDAIHASGGGPLIGMDLGVSLAPHFRNLHEANQAIDPLALFGELR